MNKLQEDKISAIDNDLRFYDLTFTITGSNLFEAQFTVSSFKLHNVQLLTTQKISRIDEEGISFQLIATVSRI